MLAAEELEELELLEPLHERSVLIFRIARRSSLALAVGLLVCELLEHLEILHGALELQHRRDFSPQRRDFLHLRLRPLLVRPEVGLGHAALDFGQPILQRGEVKDTSGARRRGA